MFVFSEDFERRSLWFVHCRTPIFQSARKNVFHIQATHDDKVIPYTYFADFSHLRIDAEYGFIEFCLDPVDRMAIRGKGIGLRLTVDRPEGACEGVLYKGGGAYELSFGAAGRSLYVPLEGTLSVSSAPGADTPYENITLDFTPGADGALEAAVHEYMLERDRDERYKSFDDVRAESQRDYELWCKNYRSAGDFEDTAAYAKFVIWSHRQGEGGNGIMKQAMIYMHRLWICHAFAWQQSYNAMSMLNNTGEGWRLICSLFDFQHESGMLPGTVSHYEASYGTPQPAMQGFAIAHILANTDGSMLTYERCKRMYEPFARWAGYWLTYHASVEPDTLEYHNPNESGWDDASVFFGSFPIQSPDLYSHIALLCEAVGRIAEGAGLYVEAGEWLERSKRFINTLIKNHWNGEKFLPRLPSTGELVDAMSLVCYQPIMLGGRLPQDIIDKTAEALMREGEYLTDIGLAAESLKSPNCRFSNKFFVLGKIIAPLQMFITVGLKSAGKVEEAREIARRWCRKVRKNGFILGFAPLPTELDGSEYPDPDRPSAGDTWSWASWTAVCFLIVSTYVLGE
ncbi:MAG: hypothetical protein LBC21_02380 [Oscillospiraceae bacterium]|jgi:hypothetical protein|nr:hypothetical protein [Oscillospiraceae bacterium]